MSTKYVDFTPIESASLGVVYGEAGRGNRVASRIRQKNYEALILPLI